MEGLWNIISFGAVGDGRTDCTQAIQAAIDEAGSQSGGGGVYVPAGEYAVGQITLHPHVRLYGETGWSIRNSGGSILTLKEEEADCLLDITGCFGCTVTGQLRLSECCDGISRRVNNRKVCQEQENCMEKKGEAYATD